MSKKPIFFKSQDELRAWFVKNHATKTELFVGFYKAKTGKKAFSWSDAVDEALCVGWIDGVLTPIDDTKYFQRFTPRRAGSTWSKINVAKVAKLTAEGRMLPAGTKAFAARTDAKTGIYSFEQKEQALPPAMLKQLRANKAAWAYWDARPPWYKRAAIHWVVSAKQEATRERRLATLIADSAAGLHIKMLRRPTDKR